MGTLSDWTVAFDEGKVIGVFKALMESQITFKKSMMSARGRPAAWWLAIVTPETLTKNSLRSLKPLDRTKS